MRLFLGRNIGRLLFAFGLVLFVAQAGWATSLSGLVISEVLADPTGFDADGDGTVELNNDEYVELFNGTGMVISLADFTIHDQSQGERHRFAAGVEIGVGEYLVVFGDTSTTGSLKVSNGGDEIRLLDAGGSVVDTFRYVSGISGESRVRHDGAIVAHTDVAGTQGSPGFETLGVPTPEPAAALLLGSGLLGLGLLGRRRN